MSALTRLDPQQLARLEERARRLAEEKSYLQLVNDLMIKLSEVPGLDNIVEGILRLILDNLGGSNVGLYYSLGAQTHYADVYGRREVLTSVEDPMVRAAFQSREFVEELRDFADTKMLTPAFTQASHWAMPLMVAGQLVGVLKTEGMLMAAAEVRSQLRPFFSYAALILKNEVERHLKLMEAAQLAAIVQSSDDAIIGKTVEGVITSWNRGAERIYGYPAAEVVGRSIGLLVPPGHPDDVPRLLAQLREGQHVEHYETVRRRKDGRDIRVSLTLSPIHNAAGGLVGVSTIARDISERIRAEAELRRMNRTLRMLSDSNQSLIRATDEAGLLNEVCRIAVEVGGYRMAWVGFAQHDEGKTVRAAAQAGFEAGAIAAMGITWADVPHGQGPVGTALRTGQVALACGTPTNPACAPWQQAARRHGYQSSIALPLTSEGQTFGVLAIYAAEAEAFDVKEVEVLKELAGDLAFGTAALRTRRSRAQAEANLQLFRQLLNHSNDAIFVVDPPTGRVLDANDTACGMLAYTRAELLNLAVTDFDPTMQDSFRWPEHLKTIQTIGSLTLESRHQRKDGTTLPVEISVRYTLQNQKEYLIAVVRDITERHRAEEDLQRLNLELDERVRERTAQLEAANTELEAFAYSVSHDLRAPLRSIDGFSQALLDDCAAQLNDQGRQHLARVQAAAQRMAQLIDDLLALARLTQGEMLMQQVSLSNLVGEIAGELARREPQRQVTWTIAPQVVASGDARFLRVALENLLGNAWKFTSRCREARIEFGASDQGGQSVYFVRDNGAGFDMKNAGRLFTVFRRLHAPEEFPGTGVGLATVQRIIHRHGGRVWAEGQVNQGATFSFTLPKPMLPPAINRLSTNDATTHRPSSATL